MLGAHGPLEEDGRGKFGLEGIVSSVCGGGGGAAYSMDVLPEGWRMYAWTQVELGP